jgi:hypothetical protein
MVTIFRLKPKSSKNQVTAAILQISGDSSNIPDAMQAVAAHECAKFGDIGFANRHRSAKTA